MSYGWPFSRKWVKGNSRWRDPLSVSCGRPSGWCSVCEVKETEERLRPGCFYTPAGWTYLKKREKASEIMIHQTHLESHFDIHINAAAILLVVYVRKRQFERKCYRYTLKSFYCLLQSFYLLWLDENLFFLCLFVLVSWSIKDSKLLYFVNLAPEDRKCWGLPGTDSWQSEQLLTISINHQPHQPPTERRWLFCTIIDHLKFNSDVIAVCHKCVTRFNST